MDEENSNLSSGLSDDEADDSAVGALPFGVEELQAKYGQALSSYEKANQKILDEITKARDFLLSQPTEKSRREYVRGLASALTAPRERTDPRFYERRNLFTLLRDIGEYGSAEEKAAKEAKLAQQQQLAKLDELRAKYEQQAAAQQLTALGPLYRETIKPKAATRPHPDVERITQLTNLINTSNDPKVVEVATRQRDAIGRNNPQAMSRFEQIQKAVRMTKSSDPKIAEEGRQIYAALKSGGGQQQLTLAQKTKDQEIKRARSFISKLTKEQIENAYMMGSRGSPEDQEIVRKHKKAQELTYEEGGMGDINEEDVVEEQMP